MYKLSWFPVVQLRPRSVRIALGPHAVLTVGVRVNRWGEHEARSLPPGVIVEDSRGRDARESFLAALRRFCKNRENSSLFRLAPRWFDTEVPGDVLHPEVLDEDLVYHLPVLLDRRRAKGSLYGQVKIRLAEAAGHRVSVLVDIHAYKTKDGRRWMVGRFPGFLDQQSERPGWVPLLRVYDPWGWDRTEPVAAALAAWAVATAEGVYEPEPIPAHLNRFRSCLNCIYRVKVATEDSSATARLLGGSQAMRDVLEEGPRPTHLCTTTGKWVDARYRAHMHELASRTGTGTPRRNRVAEVRRHRPDAEFRRVQSLFWQYLQEEADECGLHVLRYQQPKDLLLPDNLKQLDPKEQDQLLLESAQRRRDRVGKWQFHETVPWSRQNLWVAGTKERPEIHARVAGFFIYPDLEGWG